jgi:hypothetical protein
LEKTLDPSTPKIVAQDDKIKNLGSSAAQSDRRFLLDDGGWKQMPKLLPCFTGTPLIHLGENPATLVTTLDPSTPKIVAQDDKIKILGSLAGSE